MTTDRPATTTDRPASTTDSGTAVEIRGLVVEADGNRILGPVDLDVTRGEHLLLVGASGSGKSTLLRAVAGLVRPSVGEIRLFGQAVSNGSRELVAPEDRGIGYLFQGGALWPHLSVTKTLDFVLSCRKVPKGERKSKIARLVELCELGGLEDRKPPTLSGGEAQRLALARALAPEPRLLFLDEPLGPLDAQLRSALLERLAALDSELGLTTLHVTHDPDEARAVATRTLRLDGGQLAETDQ